MCEGFSDKMSKEYFKNHDLSSIVVVRGGGDIATGTIVRLFRAGFPVLALESGHPSAIRRLVALCEAVYDGSAKVEGEEAVRIRDLSEMEEVLSSGKIPLFVDPEGEAIHSLHSRVVVDAILAKKNLGTTHKAFPGSYLIALGPGFTANPSDPEGVDCVIETMRGHNLGRVIYNGQALANTGVPGIIAGHGADRVMHAKAAGILTDVKKIGDVVKEGETIAEIRTEDGSLVPVPASLNGVIRGLIRSGFPVTEGFKIADIDPRKEQVKNCSTISDKSRAIAGSVLEVICRVLLNS